jgi:hypothetical protein
VGKYFMGLIVFCNLAFGQSEMLSNQYKKIYVQPEQITLTQDGIFVYLENQWISTDILQVDAEGIYVSQDERDWFHWKCPSCQYINSSVTDSHCRKCGY